MTFPTSPTNGDLHTEFGRSYQYSEENRSWRAAVTPAPEINISTVTAFENATDLPLVNNNPGDTTFVAADNSFRLWTGSGWFEIALVNTAPTITTGANATYALNSDGTPTVITMAATDPEGTPVIWGYQVTSGSLEDTTVTNVDGVFTITPGATEATFNLSFTASDGVNVDTSASAFTLVFGWTRIHTLDHPSPGNGDNFGYAVDVDGNYAVITAANDRSVDNKAQSGKAWIYNITTGTVVHILENPNPFGTSQLDQFGYSASISGNYAIIGAWQEDEGPHPTNPTTFPYGDDSGKAYIFNVTTGALVHTLNNPNAFGTTYKDEFGTAVAISGNYAIVGCPSEDDTTNNSAGKAYIFNVTTGALEFTLNDPNYYGTSSNDYFGHSVAMDGSYAVVGSIGERNSENHLSGAAHIYNVTTGALFRAIPNPNSVLGGNGDQFGYSVAISGIKVIVGAPYEDDVNGVDSNSGKAYIFHVNGTLLETINNPNPSGSDYFGTSVAISGNYAMVGAYNEAGDGEFGSGRVYVYNVTTGVLLKTLDNPNAYGTTNGDQFGRVIAMSGNDAIISAYMEDAPGLSGNPGKAYIFKTT
jgi:hypothetical protein